YAEQDVSPAPAIVRDDPAPVSSEQIAGLRAAVEQSRRPVIWAGGGACAAGPQLTALIEKWGVPLLTSNSGRGAVAETHDLCVGNYASSPIGRELLAEADLLVSLGTHFRSNETGDYSIPVPERHVQVDLD